MSKPSEQLTIEETVADGRHTLELQGELDIHSSQLLQDAVERVRSNEARAIRIDLRRVRFVDSTGLHSILAARELCRRSGHEFSLVPGPPAVQRLFELTSLLPVLPFVEPDD